MSRRRHHSLEDAIQPFYLAHPPCFPQHTVESTCCIKQRARKYYARYFCRLYVPPVDLMHPSTQHAILANEQSTTKVLACAWRKRSIDKWDTMPHSESSSRSHALPFSKATRTFSPTSCFSHNKCEMTGRTACCRSRENLHERTRIIRRLFPRVNAVRARNASSTLLPFTKEYGLPFRFSDSRYVQPTWQ